MIQSDRLSLYAILNLTIINKTHLSLSSNLVGRVGGSRWGWVLQIKLPCHTNQRLSLLPPPFSLLPPNDVLYTILLLASFTPLDIASRYLNTHQRSLYSEPFCQKGPAYRGCIRMDTLCKDCEP